MKKRGRSECVMTSQRMDNNPNNVVGNWLFFSDGVYHTPPASEHRGLWVRTMGQ